jgi:multisubunit Na+/H+ antiporter MnhB subunit
MHRVELTIPEIAFIAGTRGALGFGAALLLSGKIPEHRRRTLGWSLVGLGVATTIPAAMKVFQRRAAAVSA